MIKKRMMMVKKRIRGASLCIQSLCESTCPCLVFVLCAVSVYTTLYVYVYPLMLVHHCHPISLDPTHHCCGIHPLGFQHKTAARTPALCPGTLLLLGQFLRRVLHTTVAGTGLVPNCARPHPLLARTPLLWVSLFS